MCGTWVGSAASGQPVPPTSPQDSLNAQTNNGGYPAPQPSPQQYTPETYANSTPTGNFSAPPAPNAGYPPQPPVNGYSTPTYGVPTQTGYSAPLQPPAYTAPPVSGGGYPPPGMPPQPPYGATPYGYPGGPVPPPQKSSKAGLIITLSIVGGLSLLIILFAVFSNMIKNQKSEEYNQFLIKITNATTPEAALTYSDDFLTFAYANPDSVDYDLKSLVYACEDYVDGDKNDAITYTNMLDEMEYLQDSSIPQIEKCAFTLYTYVNEEYAAFLAEQGETTIPDAGSLNNLSIISDVEIEYEDGKSFYSFDIENTGDKTVTYFEIWVFCYDAEGNPLPANDDLNIEWAFYNDNFLPGEVISSDSGWWEFYDFPDTVIAIPYISYAEFDDGTSAGVTSDDPDNIDSYTKITMKAIKLFSDIDAKEKVK